MIQKGEPTLKEMANFNLFDRGRQGPNRPQIVMSKDQNYFIYFANSNSQVLDRSGKVLLQVQSSVQWFQFSDDSKILAIYLKYKDLYKIVIYSIDENSFSYLYLQLWQLRKNHQKQKIFTSQSPSLTLAQITNGRIIRQLKTPQFKNLTKVSLYRKHLYFFDQIGYYKVGLHNGNTQYHTFVFPFSLPCITGNYIIEDNLIFLDRGLQNKKGQKCVFNLRIYEFAF